MAEYVLDSSAVIAHIRREPGAERVVEVASDSLLSSVNLAEVATKLLEYGFPFAAMHLALQAFPAPVVDFGSLQAMEAARLRSMTKELGLGIGDRACLALASLRGLRVITADRVWSGLSIGIDIELIR